VIISRALEPEQEEKLVGVLREHREALGWNLVDLKGLSPTLCTHTITLESRLGLEETLYRDLTHL